MFSAARVMFAAVLLLAGGAGAQTASPFGGFKHDSKAPIEITSDSLEVQQVNNLAIFAGEVVAGQGTLRLTADRVAVTYTQEKSDSQTGAIRHMRADGNVFLSNGAETATGSWAEYDIETGMVRMGGDVVLTQGGNAISGQSLVIDMNQGTGRIEAQGQGRVKSVFTPSQN
ncbi:MAG: lipopolysaccharide transport periplasmic protein LptA [Thermohalobaculum sp.]|nr:lipopolysaccharide transport periplasmic protein LptA [Thermohalobaculum sp.]